jgi:hypothetical protein
MTTTIEATNYRIEIVHLCIRSDDSRSIEVAHTAPLTARGLSEANSRLNHLIRQHRNPEIRRPLHNFFAVIARTDGSHVGNRDGSAYDPLEFTGPWAEIAHQITADIARCEVEPVSVDLLAIT